MNNYQVLIGATTNSEHIRLNRILEDIYNRLSEIDMQMTKTKPVPIPEPKQGQRKLGWYVVWSNHYLNSPKLYYWDGAGWKKDPDDMYSIDMATQYISGYTVGQRIIS